MSTRISKIKDHNYLLPGPTRTSDQDSDIKLSTAATTSNIVLWIEKMVGQGVFNILVRHVFTILRSSGPFL